MNKDSSKIFLSLVIISRNEENNIANCIESVLRAAKEIKDYEVILVDSASTDKTIDIARKYPIKIIQIDASSHFSPSAGRYIGFLHSNGKYIQFVDGDMVLFDDWFKKAFQFLIENKVAGIAGRTINKFSGIKTTINEKDDSKLIHQHETDRLSGAALFKREVLQKIGPYNPNLYGDEEAELCYRLRRAGFKLLKISSNMAIHYERNISTIEGFKIAFFRKYYLGCGQTLRYSIGDIHLFASHLFRFRVYLLYAIWIIIGLISAGIYPFRDNPAFLFFWLIGTAIFYISYSLKKSIKGAIFGILSWNLFVFGIIIGFTISPKKKELRYTEVKF